jgi:hypothetical protein
MVKTGTRRHLPIDNCLDALVAVNIPYRTTKHKRHKMLWASIVPPCISTSALLIANPSPSNCRVMERSACSKALKAKQQGGEECEGSFHFDEFSVAVCSR